MIQGKAFRDITERDLKRANIWEDFWSVSLNTIPDDLAYKSVLTKYVDQLPHVLGKGLGLLLWGELGGGKTGGGVCLLKETIVRGGSAYMVRFPELTKIVVEKHMFEGKTSVWDRMHNVDILMVDEIKERPNETYLFEMFEELVRWRMGKRKSVIMTSNLVPSKLMKVVNERAWAVLHPKTMAVPVSGKNWRTAQKEHYDKWLNQEEGA